MPRVIDATFIEAPTSTKNSAKSRDPEMHQSRKGNVANIVGAGISG